MELQTETSETSETSNKGSSFSPKLWSGQSLTSVTQQPERQGGQCPAQKHDQGCDKGVTFTPGSWFPRGARSRSRRLPRGSRVKADAPGPGWRGVLEVHVLRLLCPSRPPGRIRQQGGGLIGRPENGIDFNDFLLDRGPFRGCEIARRKDTLAQLFPDLSRRERSQRFSAPVYRPFFCRR